MTETLSYRIAVQKKRVEELSAMLEKSKEVKGEDSIITSKWAAVVNDAETELKKLENQLREVTAAAEEQAKAEGEAADAIDKTSKSTEDSTKKLSARTVAIGNIIAELTKAGAKLLREIGEVGLNYDREMERSTKALTNSLGSAEAASKAIANIKQDARNAPLYSVNTLTKANQMLISTGENAEDARKTINGLSEAISATGGGNDELTRMASNLQQIRNAGKATAMDIRQFAYAGIDVYGVLSDYTGKTTEEVKDLDVSYQLLSKAFQAAAMKGGRYFGANAAQAETLNGQISALSNTVKAKLGEAFQGTADTLRDKLLPAANDFLSSLDTDQAVDWIEALTAAAVTAGGAIYAMAKIKEIDALADGFRRAGIQLAGLTRKEQAAALSTGMLNESVGVSNIVAGVLTKQISLATAGQMAWNAAVAAFPAVAIVAGVAAVTVAVKKGIDAQNEYADSMAAEGETIDEVRANLQKLREERQRHYEDSTLYGTYEDLNTYDLAIAKVEARLREMEAAEQEAAAAEAEHEAYLETTAGKCDQLSMSLSELLTGYREAYEAAYDSLSGQFALFEQAKEIAVLTTDEMLAAMESQAAYFNSYAQNLSMLDALTAGSMGLNSDLVAMLSDGSDKSVAYAASLVQGYQEALANGDGAATEYIGNINAAFDGQQKAMDEAAAAMAASQTQIDQTLDDIVRSTAQTAADMDQYAAMHDAAVATMQGYIDGLGSSQGALYETLSGISANISSFFSSAPRGVSVPRTGGRARVDGSHASGLDYVPFDGYIAELHKGEMILNRAAATRAREAGATAYNYGGVTVNVYGQEGQSASEIADAVMYRIQDATARREEVFS